jgi:hypothetical protein
MTNLHFDRALVEQLLAHAEGSARNFALHQKGTAPPALWLVGDDGLYLMSNGDPALPGPTSKNLVCYAAECDPTKLPFETWWAVKTTAFGGDDGAEYFEASDIRAALATYKPEKPLIITIDVESIGLVAYRTITSPRPNTSAG